MKSRAGWSQAGIKIAGRNINNLRCADDTTLTESKEELKSLLMKVKENEKAGLKLNSLKAKIIATSPITSGQIDKKKVEAVTDFFLLPLIFHMELHVFRYA